MINNNLNKRTPSFLETYGNKYKNEEEWINAKNNTESFTPVF